MELDIPVGRPANSVRVIALDDELSVFNADSGIALALNRTAADVLALADGSTSIRHVVQTLARAYDVEPEEIVADVRAAVDQLISAGVIVPIG